MPTRDKRSVEELTVEELERVLALKKREQRQRQMAKMQRAGRTVDAADAPYVADPPYKAGERHAAGMAAPTNASASTETAVIAAPRRAMPAATSASTSRMPNTPHFEDGNMVFSFDDALEDTSSDAPIETYTLVESATLAQRTRRRWLDRLLVVIEVAAVIGIAAIGVSLFSAIQNLEQETAVAQQIANEQRLAVIPTIAPTPTLRLENFILPGGHTIQNGQAVFNYEEVPSHLLPLVESQWIQPVVSRPQVTSETALTLTIPALDISQTVVQGVDWEALKQGIGQLPNGTNPGDAGGNVVFAAHNDIYGQIFRHLDQLQAGDQFQVQTRTTSFTYTIQEIRTVAPDDVSVLQNRNGATATLISCYPFGVNNERIVVFANRVT